MPDHHFDNAGYLITAPRLSAQACQALAEQCAQHDIGGAGSRQLLDAPFCRALAAQLRQHPALAPLMPADAVAVQCTYFEKSTGHNWLVPLHQDLSIPVRERVQHAALTGWSHKQGQLFVQPPDSVLRQLLAVRLHLDPCGIDDGALRVVAGTHRLGRLSQQAAFAARDAAGETVCPVALGGVLALRPLLLHASSKSLGASRRRVLHFVFAAPGLPFGLEWPVR